MQLKRTVVTRSRMVTNNGLCMLTLIVYLYHLPVVSSFQPTYGSMLTALRLSTSGVADNQVPRIYSQKLPHFTAQFEPTMIPPPGDPSEFGPNQQILEEYLELSRMRKRFRSAPFNVTERAEVLGRCVANLELEYVQNQTSAPCPNEAFYAVLINAYATEGVDQGLELAEPLAKRFEFIWGVPRGARIQRAMVKTWLRNGSVSKAMDCILALRHQYALTNETRYLPDSSFYDACLFHMTEAADDDTDGVQKHSLQVYQYMRERYGNESGAIVPSQRTVRNLWKCQRKCLQDSSLLEQLCALFNQQRMDYNMYPHLTALKPTAQIASAIFMEAKRMSWNNVDLGKCTSLLEGVLQDLHKMHNETGDFEFLPNPYMYHVLVRLYRGNHVVDTTQKTMQLLHEMRRRGLSPIPQTLEDAFTILTQPNYATVESTMYAEMLLRAIKPREYGAKTLYIQKLFCAYLASNQTTKADLIWERHLTLKECDVEYLAQFVRLLSRFDHNVADAADIASTIVNEIFDRFRKGVVAPKILRKYSSVFSQAIRLWSKSKSESAFLKILDLLDKMESMNRAHPILFTLSEDMYMLALDACEKYSGHSECGTKSLSLLHRMYSLSEAGHLPTPGPLVLTSVLTSLSHSNESGLSDSNSKVFSELLRVADMDKGTKEFSYHISRISYVLYKFCNRGFDDATIQTVLHFQKALSHHPSILPNNSALTALVNFLNHCNRMDLAWDTYATFRYHAKARPGLPIAQPVFRAMTYLQANNTRELCRLSADVLNFSREGRLLPDIRLFNNIFEAFLRSVASNKFAAVDAYRLLRDVEKFSVNCSSASPNVRSYELVAAACSGSKVRFWHKMVKNIFFRARRLAPSSTQIPLTRSLFLMAISALQHDTEDEGSLEEAEKLLIELEDLWKGGRSDLTPDIKLYNSFLAVYARCPKGQRAARANIMFNKAIAAHAGGSDRCVPTTFSYNSVIRAIGNCKEKLHEVDRLRLFSVALDKFTALHSDNFGPQPNCVTYGAFARACRVMLPEGVTQTSMIQKCFDLACQNGLLTDDVVKTSYDFLSDETKSDMLFDHVEGEVRPSNLKDFLPESWTCKVPSMQPRDD